MLLIYNDRNSALSEERERERRNGRRVWVVKVRELEMFGESESGDCAELRAR
jgi:hypothetical protein